MILTSNPYPLRLQWPAAARIAVPVGKAEVQDDAMLVRYDTSEELLLCVSLMMSEGAALRLCEEMRADGGQGEMELKV